MSVPDSSPQPGWTGRYVEDFTVGDTFYSESEVLSARESASRPEEEDRPGSS